MQTVGPRRFTFPQSPSTDRTCNFGDPYWALRIPIEETANNAMTEAISFHRKIDSDAVSFHFGVKFTVRDDLAGSAVEVVGGLLFATALLTEDGDTAEDFDFYTWVGRFGDVSHSGSRENRKDYRLYRNSVRPAIA